MKSTQMHKIGWGNSMKIGIRALKNASLQVSMPTALPKKMHQGTREISHVDVPENLRRQGMATRLLQMVCKEADEANMVLFLQVGPFGEGPRMDKEELRIWYETSFGFTPIQVEPLLMARMPFVVPSRFKANPLAVALIQRAQQNANLNSESVRGQGVPVDQSLRHTPE